MKLKYDSIRGKLTARSASGEEREFDFPAAAISIKGRYIQAETLLGKPEKTAGGGILASFRDQGITFEVQAEPGGPCWFFKTVTFRCSTRQPTPDFVDVDFQKQKAPGLKRRGYLITDGRTMPVNSDEEGGGITPGCGYPLIGGGLFTGLEHPAGFNEVVSAGKTLVTWRLRHYPVWHGREIRSIRAVVGFDPEPGERFMDYLASVRLPPLKNFLVSFCSFWSDPYLGNYEYQVDSGNYLSLVRAFSKLGLRPDIYTLDAGWQDRKSFYSCKKEFGGDPMLKRIAEEFRRQGAQLSLWVSHNGPMGMDWDFLAAKGITVGSGQGSVYRGDHYAVLMDTKLEKALTRRFCQLCSPEFGAVHFKMDWENDSATHPDFAETYPSRNHVREASIDMMSRLSAAMRKTNPNVMVRNGYWPSPWWLMRSTHTFLPDSGDSEYSSFPSLSQRDAAATHRDAMYYAVLQRDGSAYPLDGFDNHEFPHALRNPFVEQPATWSNTCLWAVMRGASYLPLTLQPEALENWQAETLRQVLDFARSNPGRILTGRSRMVGGNPVRGEVYGFCHPDAKGRILLALRNASPFPKEFTLPDSAPRWQQVYPVCENFRAGQTLLFAPHEVKVLNGSSKPAPFPADCCQLRKLPGKRQYQVFLPASCRPGVAPIYRIDSLKQIYFRRCNEKDSQDLIFGIRVPYKMRSFQLFFRLTGKRAAKIHAVRLSCSRYQGWPQGSCWQVPYRELFYNTPGFGETRNPDLRGDQSVRYFAAEIPQGGECYLDLKLSGARIPDSAVELYIGGYEAPAESPEPDRFYAPDGLPVPPAHPEGFPLLLKLNMDHSSEK